MPPRFNPAKPLILLPCIICASCASVPQTCIQCFLSCDEPPELKKHKSVIVLVEHFLEDREEVCTVSSLCDGERCSVPGCFQRDTQYTLKIYANDARQVPKILVNKTNLQPDCGPEGISGRKNTSCADGKHINKFLIVLAFCFWIVFQGPRLCHL